MLRLNGSPAQFSDSEAAYERWLDNERERREAERGDISVAAQPWPEDDWEPAWG